MPRPRKLRHIAGNGGDRFLKPPGVPLEVLEIVTLGHDELEALRLADSEGLYQAEVAERMGVSRQTVGNMLKEAHRKIAEALLHDKAIRVEGGPVTGGFGHDCPGRGRRRRGRWAEAEPASLPTDQKEAQ